MYAPFLMHLPHTYHSFLANVKAAHDYHYYLGIEGSRAQKEGQAHIRKVAKMITRHVMDFWNQVDELIRLKHAESIRMKEKVRTLVLIRIAY